MNGRERVLSMLAGGVVDHLPAMPITMMFASDIADAKYRQYVTDFRVLAEGQVRTAEAFGIDYVSAISDPVREAADCGADIEWFDDQPPAANEEKALLADPARLSVLRAPDPAAGKRMSDRLEAVALLKERAGTECIVEGWVEGPCAEAADLRGINRLMMDFFERPDFVEELLEFTTALAIRFAQAQISAGADLIGVGDAAASLVGPQLYEQYVWPREKRLVDAIHAAGGRVRLHICGDTRAILDAMGRLACEIVDLDHMAPLSEARAAMGPAQVLLGNVEPVAALRNAAPKDVYAAVAECHADAGPRYIVGAGCEVVRDTPHENLRAMMQYARDHPA